MRFLIPVSKILIGGFIAFCGIVSCLRSQFPSYRTIEVEPGVFQEQWISNREIWIGIGFGALLLSFSIYLFRDARRDMRCLREHQKNETKA
jgi:hypothetical protein